MPGFRGHLIGALTLFFSFVAVIVHFKLFPEISTMQLTEWGISLCAGALFPDVDTKSRGQQFFYLVLAIVMGVSLMRQRYVTVAICGIVGLLPILVRHRTIFHNAKFVTAIVVFAAIAATVGYPSYASIIATNAVFFWVGIVSHLILDRYW